MITAEISLFAFIRKYAPAEKDPFPMELDAGATVQDVVDRLGIPDSEPFMAIINGHHAVLNTPIKNGDKVLLLTPLQGG